MADNAPGGTIVPGDKNDLATSYSNLIAQKKRLIFLNQIGASDDASKYDSYNSDLYATTNVDTTMQAFQGRHRRYIPRNGSGSVLR